jgi:hypothetical protein
METLDEITKSVKPSGFVNHVFNFNDESKDEMMNVVQYAVLAILPVVILNKATQRLIPEADDAKGTPEIAIEVILQTVSMFLGILIIHRIITYIPTHSGVKYSPLSVTSNILAVLVIILSLQTKLGEKVSILVDRAMDAWDGEDKSSLKRRPSNVKVSQPILQNQQISQSLGSSSSGSGSTPISQLPVAPQITKPPPQEYVNTYHQSNTYGTQPQASYMNNQMMEQNEPMAANFGGSSFGSTF